VNRSVELVFATTLRAGEDYGARGRLFKITLNPSSPFPATSLRPTPPLGMPKEPSAREAALNL
jgi:hypothetical protein